MLWIALRGDPVDAAQVGRDKAAALVAEGLDGPQPRARSDADDPCAVVDRADRAGDVRAMSVAVAPRSGIRARAVVAASDAQVLVRRDAGIDDRHVHVHGIVLAI